MFLSDSPHFHTLKTLELHSRRHQGTKAIRRPYDSRNFVENAWIWFFMHPTQGNEGYYHDFRLRVTKSRFWKWHHKAYTCMYMCRHRHVYKHFPQLFRSVFKADRCRGWLCFQIIRLRICWTGTAMPISIPTSLESSTRESLPHFLLTLCLWVHTSISLWIETSHVLVLCTSHNHSLYRCFNACFVSANDVLQMAWKHGFIFV